MDLEAKFSTCLNREINKPLNLIKWLKKKHKNIIKYKDNRFHLIITSNNKKIDSIL